MHQRYNVYLMCQTMFCMEFRQEDWERLKTVGHVFKCDECSTWLPTELRTPELITDLCADCSAE